MENQSPTVGIQQLITMFLFSVRAEGRSPRTHEYYEKLLKHFTKYAHQRHWPDDAPIDAPKVREFLAWISTRIYDYTPAKGDSRTVKGSPKTVWPYFKTLRRFFNWAVDQGFLNDSPVRLIRFKSPPQAPIEPYSEEEIKRLIGLFDEDIKRGSRLLGFRNKAMLMLFLDSGLRRKELAELKLGDLNIDQCFVRIVGKGGRPDWCPFSPSTARTIMHYLMERKSTARSDALWIRSDGLPLTIESVGAWFEKAKKRAGIYGTGRIHRQRHTAALQYLRGARDSFLLQLFLRHKDLTMSRRYTQGLQREEAISAHRNGGSPVMALVALPSMIKRGYDKKLAIGSIAAGGALGILIPPSVTMIFFPPSPVCQ